MNTETNFDCPIEEFEIIRIQNLVNTNGLCRLSKVQTELESQSISDYFKGKPTRLYDALFRAGLNLSFQEEEFRDCENFMMIVSRAEIRDLISTENEIVVTGCGFSIMDNIKNYDYLQTSDYNYFKNMISETRKSALASIFPMLFSSGEVEKKTEDQILEDRSLLDQRSDDFKSEEENFSQENRSELEKAMDMLDELEF